MRTYPIMKFVHPADHRVKIIKSENKNKYLDLAGELRKLWSMEVKALRIIIGTLGTLPKDFEKGMGKLERENRDHSNYRIVEIF